jgi:hypothetical protein
LATIAGSMPVPSFCRVTGLTAYGGVMRSLVLWPVRRALWSTKS